LKCKLILKVERAMHEIGQVDDIIAVIKARLKGSEPNSRVKRVNILIGELEHVSPGHFEFHFRERTNATALEGTELNFKKVTARFRCKDCNSEFSAEKAMEGCPNCHSQLNDIIAGTGIHIDSIELA
jgi:hydrogenase nickel incorporation protein HypA/HybF